MRIASNQENMASTKEKQVETENMENEPPPQDAGFQPTQEMLEQENDRQEAMLSGKVKALKSLTIDIGNEVRDQNRMLAGMDDDFDSSGNLLQSTMGRLKQITRAGGWKQMCYLLLFCLFVFFVCWVIIRSR